MFFIVTYKTSVRLVTFASVFLSLLISPDLTLFPEPNSIHSEERDLSLINEEMQEFSENTDPKFQQSEDIISTSCRFDSPSISLTAFHSNGFYEPVLRFPDHGTDIYIPPPQNAVV